MLGVVDHFAPERLQVSHRRVNHFQVLLLGDAQGAFGVQAPALAEDRDSGCSRLNEFAHVVIVFDRVGSVARRAERYQSGTGQVQVRLGALEELLVTRIGTRPAALDVVDADFV